MRIGCQLAPLVVMRLRLTILRTELKLFGLFVVELFLLNPLALVLILEFPLFFMLLWVLEGGIYFTPIGIYMLLLLAAVIIRKRQIGPDRPVGDLPLQKPLNTDPLLRDFVERVASRFRKSAPRHSFISLSPNPWHRFGVDLRTSRRLGRGLPLPITYLEILSIPELEAYIARVLVSHRGPFWLFIAVEWAIERLGAEQYQAQFRNATHRIIRARGRALQRYVDAVNGWRFLVDLDADLRVAQVVGADAVISLAYKTELANFLAAPFISEVVEPALDKQALLPIAESYAAYASAVDPHWRDAVSGSLKDLDRSSGSGSSPIIARLALLSNLSRSITVQDPRPATSAFNDYPQLEIQVAANEFGTQRVETAIRVDSTNWARLAVIPQLRDEVERNSNILYSKTRFDIPELLRNKSELAANYRTSPKFLLAQIQKQERIPYLLGAFLTLNLVDEQWAVSYQMADGIQLRSGSRQIRPFTLVEQLDAKVITDAEFINAVK